MKFVNSIKSFLKPQNPKNRANESDRGLKIRAYAALACSVIAIGITPIILRAAHAPGPIATFYRMVTAVVIMAWPFFHGNRGKQPFGMRNVAMAFVGGIFFSLDLVFWSTGVMLSGAGMPTLLSNTAPIWVGLGAMLMFRERLSTRFWTGVLVAMAGAGIILGFNPMNINQIKPGDLFGLISGFFYAGYFLVTQYGRKEMTSLAYFWIAACGTTAGLFIFSLILKLPFGGYSLFTCLLFVTMGIIGQVLGYLLVSYVLGYLPASVVSPTLLLQPVVTMLFAGLFLGESYSVLQIAGGCAVLAGVFFVQSGS